MEVLPKLFVVIVFVNVRLLSENPQVLPRGKIVVGF